MFGSGPQVPAKHPRTNGMAETMNQTNSAIRHLHYDSVDRQKKHLVSSKTLTSGYMLGNLRSLSQYYIVT